MTKKIRARRDFGGIVNQSEEIAKRKKFCAGGGVLLSQVSWNEGGWVRQGRSVRVELCAEVVQDLV